MIDENILGLEIPVDEAALVQILEHEGDLSSVESSQCLVEPVHLAQMAEHLAAVDEW